MHRRYGMILGRFQPFHLEHLRYFRLAWEQSGKVIVGITNPDPSTILAEESSDHRHLPEENPLTFIERLIMIQDTLRAEGYPMERIFIVPVPIHHPDRWRHYIPDGTAIFVVAYSPWEREKAERLRGAGYEVVVVDHLEKGISGRQIRSLLQSNGDWEKLVPATVARFMRRKLERRE
ncbi:MAG: nicotinate-nucleotide adenylyltransferase [Acidobacteria bacterium]|nr:nicotinate-nucleotide adenylyltransferase [Acidobacteriota bacterium]